MRGNSFGEFLVLTGFGESHGAAVGAVVDGCPAGIPLGREDFAAALRRRRPGSSPLVSGRMECDEPEILGGIFEGRTLGTPIAVIVRNIDARSDDYERGIYRPGHADKVWEEKYGIRDYRGGGRASGRETVARVIGGVVAEKILPSSVRIVGFARSIGRITAVDIPDELTREIVDRSPTRCPDPSAAARMEKDLLECKETGDSRGGVVELRVDGVAPSLGEPVFRKAKALLASAMMSVGAVTGVELGDAFDETRLDGFTYHSRGGEAAAHTHDAGILGGITTGGRIVLRCAVKPVSTIGETAKRGRHDPCIVPRIVPVLEAMTALVLADLTLAARCDRA
ncbi:MAG: chorismate synthase [Bacteroidota bacterium]|nr:chorismate synthase [Bacteroidota bacterium]